MTPMCQRLNHAYIFPFQHNISTPETSSSPIAKFWGLNSSSQQDITVKPFYRLVKLFLKETQTSDVVHVSCGSGCSMEAGRLVNIFRSPKAAFVNLFHSGLPPLDRHRQTFFRSRGDSRPERETSFRRRLHLSDHPFQGRFFILVIFHNNWTQLHAKLFRL